jgi:hypothetical protein
MWLRTARSGVRDSSMLPNCLRRISTRPSAATTLASMSMPGP